MTTTDIVNKTKSLSPSWLGAIAAGAGAAAAIVPGNRVLAALAGGGIVWAIAVFGNKACCAGCADKPVDQREEPMPAPPFVPQTWTDVYAPSSSRPSSSSLSTSTKCGGGCS